MFGKYCKSSEAGATVAEPEKKLKQAVVMENLVLVCTRIDFINDLLTTRPTYFLQPISPLLTEVQLIEPKIIIKDFTDN